MCSLASEYELCFTPRNLCNIDHVERTMVCLSGSAGIEMFVSLLVN